VGTTDFFPSSFLKLPLQLPPGNGIFFLGLYKLLALWRNNYHRGKTCFWFERFFLDALGILPFIPIMYPN